MVKVLIIIFMMFSIFLDGQNNILQNGDFEKIVQCPQNHTKYLSTDTNKILLPHWHFINRSTPDFFHRCSKDSDVGIPCNFAGCSEPLSGNGYIGMILRVDSHYYQYNKGYVEHIATEIFPSLDRNHFYLVKFFYKLAPNSGIASNGLGVYFSASLPKFNEFEEYKYFEPQIYLDNTKIIDNREWKEFIGYFIASGTEKFLTIGNFSPFDIQKTKVLRNGEPQSEMDYYAYYYIDDVQLYEISDTTNYHINTICTQIDLFPVVKQTYYSNIMNKLDTLSLNKPFILENIYFDFDSYRLSSKSFATLDSIANYLKDHKTIEFIINGHTDNIGSSFYNQWLSTERAKSVYKYFYESGISPARMQYIGYGDSMPITSNKTNEGRQKNRRVELVIIKK
ncbi:MAG TPA: OmpA family protein [Bacteroidales bacterium]|nr:OmpA family protein [Bacteroidales bacterium]